MGDGNKQMIMMIPMWYIDSWHSSRSPSSKSKQEQDLMDEFATTLVAITAVTICGICVFIFVCALQPRFLR